jgi:threonine/homoserine/homoserine lactone efflux protein
VPEPKTIAAFAAAAYVFAVLPGPAVIYVVTRSIDHGRLGGVISVLGIATGNLVHVVAATLGLSALLMSSALAFTAVKYAGAGYLIYLGIRALLDREGEVQEGGTRLVRSASRLYGQGALVATLNPKTALFFLAFLPQFIDPSKGPVPAQVGFLGVLLVVITALSDSCYALVSGTAGNLLRANGRVLRRRRVFGGGIYIGLGVTAALTGSRPTTE